MISEVNIACENTSLYVRLNVVLSIAPFLVLISLINQLKKEIIGKTLKIFPRKFVYIVVYGSYNYSFEIRYLQKTCFKFSHGVTLKHKSHSHSLCSIYSEVTAIIMTNFKFFLFGMVTRGAWL